MCAVYHTPRHTWVSVGRSHDVVRRQEVGVPTSPQRLCFRLRVSEARAEVTAAALADKIRDWELTRIWERKPLVSVRVACGIDLPRCFRDHLGCAGQGRDGTGSERFPCWATAEGASQVSDRASNGFARRLPQVLAQSSHRSQEIATVAIVGTTDSSTPILSRWSFLLLVRVRLFSGLHRIINFRQHRTATWPTGLAQHTRKMASRRTLLLFQVVGGVAVVAVLAAHVQAASATQPRHESHHSAHLRHGPPSPNAHSLAHGHYVNGEQEQDQAGASPCSTLTTAGCVACSSFSSCAWCASAGQCVPSSDLCLASGTLGGPVSSPDQCACIDGSAARTTCSSCVISGCQGWSWCAATGTCLFGNATGPFNTTCPAVSSSGQQAGWIGDADQCVCADVSPYTSCYSCLGGCGQAAGAGWCAATGQCVLANDTSACASTATNGGAPALASNSAVRARFAEAPALPAKATTAPAPITTSLQQCMCQVPGALTECASCLGMCGGVAGWCPSTGQCIPGNSTHPASGQSCPTTDEGVGYVGQVENGGCAAEIPPSVFTQCDACTVASSQNGWCPSTNTCHRVGVDGTPYGNVTCTATPSFGSFTTDCNCANPSFIDNSESCSHQCDSSYGFQWCANTFTCLAATKDNPDPCNPSCGANCMCLPGSASNCTLCRMGYTSPSKGCTERCLPNCKDCQPTDRATCLTQCAGGLTGFPNCTTPCPPQCAICGGSWVGSKVESSQCVLCADAGAAAPACTECLPGICRGGSGACDTPCQTADLTAALGAPRAEALELGVGAVNSSSLTAARARSRSLSGYENCDSCVDNSDTILDAGEISMKVWATVEEAELAALQAESFCIFLPPPFDLLCSFGVAATAGGEAVATWIGTYVYNKAGARTACVAAGYCAPPCSCCPDRSAPQQPRVV